VREVLLLGASGLAREAASALPPEYRAVGILDDNTDLLGQRMAALKVLGGIDDAAEHGAQLLVCVGSGAGRRRIVDRLSRLGVGHDRYATLIGASVRIPQSCNVGSGSILLGSIVLTDNVTIGRHVVVMPNVTLTHDTVIGDFATVTAGVSLAGAVVLEDECYVGMNATIRQNVRVGQGAMVGMGAAVVSDVPAGETWAGVPAKRMVKNHDCSNDH
jgi:sugar O-acyltransferase (sialic acid O-acetyltransferase NeuD family)